MSSEGRAGWHGDAGERPSLSARLATIGADLWRGRRGVVAVAVVALLIGLAMSFRVGIPPESRSYEVGVGSALALVDTQQSLAVDLSGNGGGRILKVTDRAALLANLMTASPLKDEIAAAAGVPAGALVTQQPSTLADRQRRTPRVPTAQVSADDPGAYVLHVAVNPLLEGANPIIAVDTRAPDPAAAARLADGAVATIQAYVERGVDANQVPPRRRVVVRQLEPAEASTERLGPSGAVAAGVGLIVLALGCAVIALLGALRRRRSGAGAGPRFRGAAQAWPGA